MSSPKAQTGPAGTPMIGRYEAKQRIGTGGMGQVWLCRHPSLGIDVAVKKIIVSTADDLKDIADRFLREARALARVEAPNVVRIYEVGTDDDGIPFMVLEYMDGGDAEQLAEAAGGRLSPGCVLDIAESMAAALREAQRRHVVHRDIKPANILFSSRGEIKLSDLGLARCRDELNVHTLTVSGVAVGTPAYIAPEQALRARDADVRSDIYSLGATLYRLATGTLPFSGETPFETIMKHVEAPLQDPRMRNGALPDGLAEIILRMMEKDPTDRYQTPGELAQDVARLRQGKTIVRPKARRTTAGAKGGAVAALKRVAVGLGILLAVALFAVIYFPLRTAPPPLLAPPLPPEPSPFAEAVLYYPMDPGDGGPSSMSSRGSRDTVLQLDGPELRHHLGRDLLYLGGKNTVKAVVAGSEGLPLTGAGDFTVAFWIQALKGGEVLAKLRDGEKLSPLVLHYDDGLQVISFRQIHGMDGKKELVDVVTAQISSHRLWHCAVVKDGMALRVYVDGVLATEATKQHATECANAAPLRLGNVTETGAFEGYLGGLGLWDKALSAVEILRLVGVEGRPKPDPIIGVWVSAAAPHRMLAFRDDGQLDVSWDTQTSRQWMPLAPSIYRYSESGKYVALESRGSTQLIVSGDKPESYQRAATPFFRTASGLGLRVLVDGRSDLRISQEGLQWIHYAGSKPGDAGEPSSQPSSVNGNAQAWHHQWLGSRSKPYRIRTPSLQLTPSVSGREPVRLLREPDALVIAFNDSQPGADWYSVTLSAPRDSRSGYTWRNAGAPRLRVPLLGSSFVVEGVDLTMKPISPGETSVGSSRSEEVQPLAARRSIRISKPYWMSQTEVTRGQWAAVMHGGPAVNDLSLPVANVNWMDAQSFCRALTVRERVAKRLPPDYEYRLPTEAEWEHAARAGAKGARYLDGGLDRIAWHAGNSRGALQAVGGLAANALGLHDVYGNVWELCLDDYLERIPTDATADPVASGSNGTVAIRGGSIADGSETCDGDSRRGVDVGTKWPILGFRVALARVVRRVGGRYQRLRDLAPHSEVLANATEPRNGSVAAMVDGAFATGSNQYWYAGGREPAPDIAVLRFPGKQEVCGVRMLTPLAGKYSGRHVLADWSFVGGTEGGDAVVLGEDQTGKPDIQTNPSDPNTQFLEYVFAVPQELAWIALSVTRTEQNKLGALIYELECLGKDEPIRGEKWQMDLDLSNEGQVKELLRLGDKYSHRENGMHAPRRGSSSLQPRGRLGGDFVARFDFSLGSASYTNTGGCWFTAAGQQFCISLRHHGFGAKAEFRRKGNLLTYNFNGAVATRELTSRRDFLPADLYLYWRSRGAHFRCISFEADYWIPEPRVDADEIDALLSTVSLTGAKGEGVPALAPPAVPWAGRWRGKWPTSGIGITNTFPEDNGFYRLDPQTGRYLQASGGGTEALEWVPAGRDRAVLLGWTRRWNRTPTRQPNAPHHYAMLRREDSPDVQLPEVQPVNVDDLAGAWRGRWWTTGKALRFQFKKGEPTVFEDYKGRFLQLQKPGTEYVQLVPAGKDRMLVLGWTRRFGLDPKTSMANHFGYVLRVERGE